MYEGAVQNLIDELGRLPGVGPKSAQRIAFYILNSDADQRDFEGQIECELLRNMRQRFGDEAVRYLP